MKDKIKFKAILLVLLVIGLVSCTNDLDTEPIVEQSLDQILDSDPNAVDGILSRIYASYALSGIDGSGSRDIQGDDAGESPFLRGIVNLQDFSADAMKNRWGDDGLDQLTTTSAWDENNKFFRYLFNRIYFTIPQCNNLLIILGNEDFENEEVVQAEVRFLRALAYYYLIDVFGKGVLSTEENFGGTDLLPEVSRTELFNYVESELLAIESQMAETPLAYGRADRAAGQMLLAKLYLNAEVYTGTQRYADALTFITRVIEDGGHILDSDFVRLFSADNNTSSEIIFPILADAVVSQSFGNTTYLVNGSLSTETMDPNDFGALQGWTGHRSSQNWYGLFGSSAIALANSNDVRASLFWTDGHNFEMNDYRTWTDGFPSTKFRNTNADGSGSSTDFSSTDFPLFRLADAYLMYAECVLRDGGGDINTALGYVNAIRSRAGADAITTSELTLDFILDERARELNFEGHRRSDLIRYGRFTGSSYIWPWKGGVANGTSIPDHYNLYPLPISAIQANPNLTQNPGF
ncbi:RagB/SusD family nutrient uptake outer membrane protein [Allomuricauda sp. SCSIO 65647]|uniref:RagB/SusD family nutrient uptake outer membrane protein n=1 Tax=Allomuricauda sp. SCSIO 65647 TaxID=2908843 RepID=UPI001F4135B0|nr:RagB/SusD family nutrient uptake outer membrane protein [Muricauda sp. SCSIO 65647]UJH66245.1 RagB/SusD family nutrient uptake outer membrane protein [Muricauda sp. SCSIO 65647]